MRFKQVHLRCGKIFRSLLHALIFNGETARTGRPQAASLRMLLFVGLLATAATVSATEPTLHLPFTIHPRAIGAGNLPVELGACDNVINGGTIEGDEFGCPNPTWNPGIMSNVTLPTGGSGNLEYLWIFTTGDPNQPLTQWTPIANTNTPSYDPGPLSQTTHYRRCARRGGCSDYVGETNIVTKFALCCDPVTSGGIIAANQNACQPPFDPATLTNVTLPTGGTGTLEYQWVSSTTGTAYTPANPDWTLILGANSETYDPGVLNQTTDYIRLSRRFGCTDYNGVSNIVTINFPLLLTASAVPDAVTCFGGSDGAIALTLTNGLAPFQFNWTPSLGNVEDPQNLSAGVYAVTVTDANGCTTTASTSIADGAQLTATMASTAVTCFNGSDGTATVSAVNGGTLPYTYLWNDPAAQITATAGNLPAGNYSVTVTDVNGCTTTLAATIANGVQVAITLTMTDETCLNDADGSATVSNISNGAQPFNYLWNDPAAQTNATATNLPAGNYSVTVTDDNGCTASGSILIGTGNMLQLSTLTTAALCFGSSNGAATVSVTGGNPADFTYLWNNAGASTSVTVNGLAAGTYSVTVTDAIGCSAVSNALVEQPSPLTLAFDSTPASCFSSSDGTATVTPSGGTPFSDGSYTYIWNAAGTPTVQALDDVSPGTYSVTVLDANNCGASGEVTIEAPTKVTVSLAATNVSCFGAANGSILPSPSGGTPGYILNWSNGSGAASIANLAPGAYSLTVTDTQGCSGTASTSISEPSQLTLSLQKTDVVCAEDTDGQVTAIANGGTTPYLYAWNGGQSSASINNLPTGTYSLTVTDGNSCTAFGATTIIFTSDFNAAVSSQDAVCADSEDGQAFASGFGGALPYQYLWSNGATTTDLNELAPGNYTVTVTDANACTKALTVSINAPPQLTCATSLVSHISTFGGNDGVAAVTAGGGVGGFTYLWTSGSTTASASNLMSGNYSVTTTDANGCACVSHITMKDPSKVGNFVWNDLDQDGIQDAGEPGLEGVTLHFVGNTGTGVPVNFSTVSGVGGNYAFDGLASGFYRVEADLLPNTLFSPNDVGSDSHDSDVNPATGVTPWFALAEGYFDQRWDAGILVLDEVINLGDYVWHDLDQDGIQGINEFGVEGLTVRLLASPSNTILASTTTDGLGHYLFADVAAGNYVIEFLVASVPAGYIFAEANQGGDDTKDSDANIATGKTGIITVVAFTPDNLTIDAGIHKECDNVTDGGLIGYDEDLCGVNPDPAIIVEINPPTGGFGALEYLWMQSNVPVWNGPGDPNWQPVPNSNSPSYDPGPIAQTTYYIRCSRREDCDAYVGESNIVAKTLIPLPLAQIVDEPGELCEFEDGRFEAAIAGGGATYVWDFGAGATPVIATTRVVNSVTWAVFGIKTVTLTVTRFGCSWSATTTVTVLDCGNNLIVVDDLGATLQGNEVHLHWQNGEGLHSDGTFFVQRSEDGAAFENLGSLAAQPVETDLIYQFIDPKPRIGENIYRIQFKATQSNQEAFSNEIAVAYEPEGVRIAQVFPNPVQEILNIELLETNLETAPVEVSNAVGKVLIISEVAANQQVLELDLSELPGGVYFVKISQKGWKEQVRKVVKTD